jgi:hypothetical protein
LPVLLAHLASCPPPPFLHLHGATDAVQIRLPRTLFLQPFIASPSPGSLQAALWADVLARAYFPYPRTCNFPGLAGST